MARSLCKMKRQAREDFDSYVNLVDRPRHVCAKCGRAANKKKNLCDPRKI